MTAARLISVDWGTTSLRCALVDDGAAVLDERRSEQGITKTAGLSFADILAENIASWRDAFGSGGGVPVLMSGMIGSRQGWVEAAYLRCPAAPRDIAHNLTRVAVPGDGLTDFDVRIVPGMDQGGGDQLPDVMRGEETQVLGALLATGRKDGVFVLPGTHSKWVFVHDETITGFRTFMTGEVFSALLDATILGQLAESHELDSAAGGFEAGVETALQCGVEGRPGDLLNFMFSARSRVLLGELSGRQVRGYLSGLLIGSELLSGMRALEGDVSGGASGSLNVLAEQVLGERYLRAAELAGICAEASAEGAVARAHLAIARLAGLVS